MNEETMHIPSFPVRTRPNLIVVPEENLLKKAWLYLPSITQCKGMLCTFFRLTVYIFIRLIKTLEILVTLFTASVFMFTFLGFSSLSKSAPIRIYFFPVFFFSAFQCFLKHVSNRFKLK